MNDSTVLGLLFLLLFVGLLSYFIVQIKDRRAPLLRRIDGFAMLKGMLARAVESGRTIHLSVGVGGVGNETTADSLAGLSVLAYLNEKAVQTEVPPVVTTADPMVMLVAQNVARAAHANITTDPALALRQIRWIAPQPAAYAAGVMNILNADDVDGNVMVGKFGDEYLLMGETAARRQLSHVGGTSNPNTLPFIYATAQETLLGEEIYAAGAYLQKIPTHIASLMAQDTIRWLIALIILGGNLVNTLR